MTSEVIVIRNQMYAGTERGNSFGACRHIPVCGRDWSSFRARAGFFSCTCSASSKVTCRALRRPVLSRLANGPSVAASGLTFFGLRRWSSNSVAHRRSIGRFLPVARSVATHFRARVRRRCPVNSRVLDNVLQDQIDAPENHRQYLSSSLVAVEANHDAEGFVGVKIPFGAQRNVFG